MSERDIHSAQPWGASFPVGSPFIRETEILVNPVEVLTTRQLQIMDLVVAGHPSKIIAVGLGISRRTVENHRACIMKKTGSTSIPALVRWSMTFALNKLVEPVL